MKVSYNWLRELLAFELTPEELADTLTGVGLPVETMEPLVNNLNDLVVAELLEIVPHPNADRLSLTTVSTGKATHSVVCGAGNIAVGDKVPFAPVGASLPGGINIKRAKLRGVESEGMLCSSEELELALVQKTDGLLHLPAESVPGQSLVESLGLDDWILDIELTANRSDCLSIRGLVTEIAAALGHKFLLPLPQPVSGEGVGVTITLDTENCPRYTGMVIRDVEVGPSPLAIQLRLLACGMRPINNIVDATNLVMLEWGQPLHAFDLDKLPGPNIGVRQARAGEEMVTLDEKTRQLTPAMMLITADDKPVAIAGVMGSLDSEVDQETRTILLESAHFAALNVRLTAKALGIASEAATRFEKGIDPAIVVPAAWRAADLISRIASGQPGQLTSTGEEQSQCLEIPVHLTKVNQLLGTELNREMALATLNNLGLAVTDGSPMVVAVDGRRQDLRIWQDIAEELGRIYGLDKIPAHLPRGETTPGTRAPWLQLEWLIRDVLAGCGLSEVITYSFLSPQQSQRALAPQGVAIANPLTQERSQMRSSMLPSLLEAVQYNLAHGQSDLSLFELGHTYHPDQPLPRQQSRVAGILCGQRPVHWQGSGQYDFYACKGVVEELLAAVAIDADYVRVENAQFHPGRSAAVYVGPIALGHLGQVSPQVSASLRLEQPLYFFDLDLEALDRARETKVNFAPPSRFPAIARDLALELPTSVSAQSVLNLIRQFAGPLLEKAVCFDVYSGPNLSVDRKSVAFALSFRHQQRTLKDEEIQDIMELLVKTLAQETGARLRGN